MQERTGINAQEVSIINTQYITYINKCFNGEECIVMQYIV